MNLENDLPVVIGHLLVSDPLELVALPGKGTEKYRPLPDADVRSAAIRFCLHNSARTGKEKSVTRKACISRFAC